MQLKKTVGRLATYLQAYGDLMVRTNDWDPAVLERFRADPFVAGFRGALDAQGDHRRAGARRHADPRRVAGSGRPRLGRAVRRGGRRTSSTLGADGVILHGAAPAELRPIVEAYHPRR